MPNDDIKFKFNYKTGSKKKFVIPPYKEIFHGNVKLINRSHETGKSLWYNKFELYIVEAIPGTRRSKVTIHIYKRPLAAYDPAIIHMLTKEHAERFERNTKIGDGDHTNFPNEYKR